MVQPITAEERKGRSFWLEAPWGHLLYVLGRFLRGHLRRCKWSVEWRDVSDVYLTKRPTQVIFETVGAGAKSQPASWICSVGPSSLINASDLDAFSFVPNGHKVIGIKAHCPIDDIYANVGMACQNG